MSRAAVEAARKIGKALAASPSSIALRKAVWREMGPLRRAMYAHTAAPSHNVEEGR